MAISSDSPDKITGLFKFGFSTNKNVNQKAETSMLKRNSIEGTATALEHQQPYPYLPMWTSRSRALLVRIVQAPDVWQLLFYFGNLIFTLLARHGKLILKLNVNPCLMPLFIRSKRSELAIFTILNPRGYLSGHFLENCSVTFFLIDYGASTGEY